MVLTALLIYSCFFEGYSRYGVFTRRNLQNIFLEIGTERLLNTENYVIYCRDVRDSAAISVLKH
jgi:hypothetical protein